MKFAGTAVEGEEGGGTEGEERRERKGGRGREGGGGREKNGGRGMEGKEGREIKVTKSDTVHIVYCTITNSVVGARPVSIVHTQGDVWDV